MNKESNIDLTVIVPFYKRDEYAKRIMQILDKEVDKLKFNVEVIFSDSNSSVTLENNLKNISYLSNIKYRVINTKNELSTKRNFGIKNSKSDKIILIDDDCFPKDKFLENHNFTLEKNKNKKMINSGIVTFDKDLINESNFIRYKDQRHRNLDFVYNNNDKLNLHNIVAMNLSCYKSDIIEHNLWFDEDYKTYGLEDTQFALDALKKGFALKTSNAAIIHQDSTSIDVFFYKIKLFTYNYFFKFYLKNSDFINDKKNLDLIIINQNNLNYSPLIKFAKIYHNHLKKNYLILPFIFMIKNLALFIAKILIKTLKMMDKKKNLYFYPLYKFLTIITIIHSLFSKKNIPKDFI